MLQHRTAAPAPKGLFNAFVKKFIGYTFDSFGVFPGDVDYKELQRKLATVLVNVTFKRAEEYFKTFNLKNNDINFVQDASGQQNKGTFHYGIRIFEYTDKFHVWTIQNLNWNFLFDDGVFQSTFENTPLARLDTKFIADALNKDSRNAGADEWVDCMREFVLRAGLKAFGRLDVLKHPTVKNHFNFPLTGRLVPRLTFKLYNPRALAKITDKGLQYRLAAYIDFDIPDMNAR